MSYKKASFVFHSERFTLICLFMIFIDSSFFICGKPLPHFQKMMIGERNLNENPENEELYDTYFIIYFNRDCNYPTGFKNEVRNNISFIINREKNTNLTSEETLVIH